MLLGRLKGRWSCLAKRNDISTALYQTLLLSVVFNYTIHAK